MESFGTTSYGRYTFVRWPTAPRRAFVTAFKPMGLAVRVVLGRVIVMCTSKNAPKLPALGENPTVA